MDGKQAGLESAAAQILVRAVEMENKRQLTESLACYKEGISLLLQVLKGQMDESRRAKLRQRVEEYMVRAEKIKTAIERDKNSGQYHEQIQIEAGSTGHSYESIFRSLIDDELSAVEVDDPYVRAGHQLLNFVRLCELFAERAPRLKTITLSTGYDQDAQVRKNQIGAFEELKDSLRSHTNIDLNVKYSDAMHDREIRLNNGWIVKIGRGLDYFRPVSKYSLGYCNMNLRPCHQTTVDIFHKKFTRNS